jgi:hypothetical protein
MLPTTKPARKLLEALVFAQTTTKALTNFINPTPLARRGEVQYQRVTIESLTLARNDVHHSLISLPPANALWGREFALYEVLRVMALIFSDLVLFPLPAETGVRRRYAQLLREGLASVSIESLWRDECGLLLWGCVLGAVAAADTLSSRITQSAASPSTDQENGEELRNWYVRRVRACSEMLGVGLSLGLDAGWDEVKTKVCARYLWWDDVCDVVGRKAWEEVIALHFGGMDQLMPVDGLPVDLRFDETLPDDWLVGDLGVDVS